jgi:hypothetical protein
MRMASVAVRIVPNERDDERVMAFAPLDFRHILAPVATTAHSVVEIIVICSPRMMSGQLGIFERV